MDNLRSAIEIIFVRRDFDRVISDYFSVTPENSFPEDQDLASLYTQEMTHYGSDTVSSIQQMVLRDWICGDKEIGETTSVFNLLLRATKKMIVAGSDTIQCSADQYLRWNELSGSVGEDLLTTASLAYRDVRNSVRRASFGWKPFLDSNSRRINSILEKDWQSYIPTSGLLR